MGLAVLSSFGLLLLFRVPFVITVANSPFLILGKCVSVQNTTDLITYIYLFIYKLQKINSAFKVCTFHNYTTIQKRLLF